MNKAGAPATDEQWQAIINNDETFNGRFFYAVATTGIFCRPSCKSRPPKRENIEVYETADQALSARYRPCKRCKPTGQKLPDQEWIGLVTEYIGRNFSEKLSLDHLAGICHGTPYHLHRTFKKITGITPNEYVQQVRLDKAKTLLTSTDNAIAEVGKSVGLPNTPYFITLFKHKYGDTPESYRRKHKEQLAAAKK